MKQRARPYNLNLRLTILAAALGCCGIVLVGRAAQMQLLNKDFYQHQGDQRFLREVPIPTSRGMIMDRNGEPLAVSTPVESVWANPKELLQHADRLPELAEALGIPQDVLAESIAQRSDKEFVFLRRRINPDDAEAVVKRGIPGVYKQREFRRFYPHGEVMAHVLGFTNIDDHGQEGLELAFDSWLTGKPGAQRVIRDRRGRIVENVDLIRAAEPGKDITLSIDRRIQYLAYRELKAALIESGADSGSVVIVDVADRRNPGDGQPARLQPEFARGQQPRRASQPRGHRRGRAGLGDEAVHGGGRARERPRSEHDGADQPGLDDARQVPDQRHPRPRAGGPDAPARHLVEHRRGQARPGHDQRAALRRAASLRLWRQHAIGFPGRVGGRDGAAEDLGRSASRQHLLRHGPVGHAAAAGPGLRGPGQSRPPEAADLHPRR